MSEMSAYTSPWTRGDGISLAPAPAPPAGLPICSLCDRSVSGIEVLEQITGGARQ